MRIALVASLVSAALGAQSNPTPSPAEVAAWDQQRETRLAAYALEKAVWSAKAEKMLSELERLEASFLLQPTNVSPATRLARASGYTGRQGLRKRIQLSLDSTAAEYLVAARGADPEKTVAALRARGDYLRGTLPTLEPELKRAKDRLAGFQWGAAPQKSGPRSSYLEQGLIASRTEVEYLSDEIKAIKAELKSISVETAAASQLVRARK